MVPTTHGTTTATAVRWALEELSDRTPGNAVEVRVLNGLETIRIVKRLNALLPCIIISADANDELRRCARLADAYSVLKKPVSRRELFATVSTALGGAYDDEAFEG